MELYGIFLIALGLIGAGLFEYHDKKQRIQQSKVLNLEYSKIIEDVENICHRVGKDLNMSILLSTEFLKIMKQTPTQSAFHLQFPLLIKEELAGEELLYVIKNLQLELNQVINMNHYEYDIHRDNLLVQFQFNTKITKRSQLNYIDLHMFFSCDEKDLEILLKEHHNA